LSQTIKFNKSVGKIVLFRDDGNLTNSSISLEDPSDPPTFNKEQEGLKQEWFESQQRSIIRTQTFNYSVDGKNNPSLEDKPAFDLLLSVYQHKDIKDAVHFNTDQNMLFSDEYQINLQPYNSLTNAKGMLASDYSFVSHNLSLPRPLTTSESKSAYGNKEVNLTGFGFDDQLTVTPVYNYYLADYENFKLAKGGVTGIVEKAIPSFYDALFHSKHLQENDVPLSWGNKKIEWSTIEHYLKNFSKRALIDGILYGTGKKDSPWRQYILELNSFQERNSFIVLTSDFYKTHNSLIEKQKDTYPLYNKISIPTIKQGTAIQEFFKQIKYYDDLQFSIATALKALVFMKTNAQLKTTVDNITSNYNLYTFRPKIQGYSNTKKTTLRPNWFQGDDLKILEFRTGFSGDTGVQQNIDLPQVAWVSNLDEADPQFNPNAPGAIPYVSLKQNIDKETFTEVAKLLGSVATKSGTSALGWWTTLNLKDYKLPLVYYGNEKNNNQVTSGMSKAKAETILPKLINVIKLKAASVFQNKQNYSEVLYYEIAKFKGAYKEDNIPIQTFLLPNDMERETVEYIDSQIKYGKEYYYQIYAHTISIGNNLKRGGADFNWWLYENNYDVKLLRVPYYNIPAIEGGTKSGVTVNLDSPPMPPNIEFFPYKNVSDKIGFWFNIQMGEAFMIPEKSLLSNKQYKSLIAASFEKRGTDQEGFTYDADGEWLVGTEIFYKTDDYGGKFEVFRLTERPKTYADFKNAKISTIDVLGDKTLISDIQPNQDYYYIFRTIDVHGMPSNPTPVYHFKMITHNDIPETDSVHIGVSGGQPVLFNELIYLDDNYEKKIDNKSFKKYLLIEPSLKQSFLSFDNFGAEKEISTKNEVLNKMSDLTFGNSEEKLFDKKFKIRITSKQTGRKLDVNVHFKSPSIDESYEES